jgi:hypothetical protein
VRIVEQLAHEVIMKRTCVHALGLGEDALKFISLHGVLRGKLVYYG